MSDDIINPTPNGDGQHEGDGTDVRTVPFQRFKQVNDRYRATLAELEALKQAQPPAPAEATQATRAAVADTPPAAVADDYRERYEAAAAEVAALKLARLKANVCYQAGVPIELADRLQGDSEDALKADLAALLRLGFGAAPTPPNIGADARNDAPPGFRMAQLTDPAFYRANADAIQRALVEGRIFS